MKRYLLALALVLMVVVGGCASDEDILAAYERGYDSALSKISALERQLEAQKEENEELQQQLDAAEEKAEETVEATPAPAPASASATQPTTSGTTTSSSDYSTVTVYVTDTGEKYHRSGCQYLRNSKHEIYLSQAQALGYTPCSRCHPPQ